MNKRVRLYRAAMIGLAMPVAALATPQSYTDTQGDQVGSTNAARDIWSATVDDDGTNLYFTINLNPAANIAGNNFDYAIGLTSESPSAGGDTAADTKTLGNPYNRNLSISSSLGGMLGFVGLFGVGGSGTTASPFTGYGFNDYSWSASNSAWTVHSSLNSTTAGIPFNKQVGGANQSSIVVAVPIADFSSSLSLTTGTTFGFDIYSTGTTAGQTAYDSLADSSPTNSTNSATAQYIGTVLDTYTVQGTSPLSLVWSNSGGVGDGATWDSAENGVAGGALNQNWLDSTTPTFFFPNNAVVFNDANNGHYAVSLNSTVKPAAVTFNNSSGNYTLSGSGAISGTTGIVKLGTGSVAISTGNSFTGGVNVSGGTLILSSTTSLGFGARYAAGQTPGGTVVYTNGTLDLNARAITEPVTLSGGTLTNSNSSSSASLTEGVKAVTVTSATGPFSADANLVLTGGSGTGAVSKVVLSLSQASLSLTGKGAGYSTAPTVAITGGGGSSGTATATLGLSNASIGITNGGVNYTVAPTVTITGGNGTGATATATIAGGQVTAIAIVNPGTGYTTAPTVTLTGGADTSPATLTSNATNFIVSGITLGNAGLNYTSVPAIALSGGLSAGGTAASATVLDSHFTLLGITQITPGTGYTTPPTAAFTATTGSVTLGTVVNGSVTLTSDSSIGGVGNLNISGGIAGTGGLNKVGADTLTLSAANSYSGNTNVSSGTLTVDTAASLASPNVTVFNGATLNVKGSLSTTGNLIANGIATFAAQPTGGVIDPITLGSLSVGSTGAVSIANPGIANHSSRAVLVTSGLSFAGSTDAWAGSLDLSGNDLIVHGGNLATITNQAKSGMNTAGGGYWNGPGIASSAAATDTTELTAIGVIQNDNGSGGALYTSFDGQTVSDSDVLAKYTYYGDANLDGIVDASDYSRIDNGFVTGATGWMNGDFNYDGVINGSDYTLIDNAFNTQGASLADSTSNPLVQSTAEIAGSSAVPEPVSMSLIAIGTLGLIGRRRR